MSEQRTSQYWPFGGLEPGKYRALAIDPPWNFRARTALQTANWESRLDVEKHYEVMGVDGIAALPVQDLDAISFFGRLVRVCGKHSG